MVDSIVAAIILVDMRMPSRRFYVTRIDDFEEIQRTVKRNKLSLKKKSGHQSVDQASTSDADTQQSLSRIEDTMKKV